MRTLDFEKGEVLLINKPKDWTSFDVVKKLRNVLRVKKIGHGGTLDPLATGLLIVCTGKMTKRIEEFQGLNKSYEGVIEIGKTTPSFDLETEFDSESPIDNVDAKSIRTAISKLTGSIEQVPPVFSAVKVDGKRAYKSARKNEEVKLKSRQVTIEFFNTTHIELPEVHFNITCSKGTYIRSIANDFGKLLGCGAYLKELRRTAIGDYKIEDSYALTDFVSQYQKTKNIE